MERLGRKRDAMTTLLAPTPSELLEREKVQVYREFMRDIFVQITVLVCYLAVFFAIGVVFYHSTEGWTVIDSLYFCCATISTVGYGGENLEPTTPGTKVFTIAYVRWPSSAPCAPHVSKRVTPGAARSLPGSSSPAFSSSSCVRACK